MPRNTSFSLTGKNTMNCLALNEFRNRLNNMTRIEIENLKIMIMNLIIIPFLTKNWKKLIENICFIDNINNKINECLKLYGNDENLLLYKNLLSAFELLIIQYMEIENLEKFFRDDCENVSNIVFKTTMIRLKAEYELYNLILGKPKLLEGEKYNVNIINDIISLLKLEETNFDKIKSFILSKYNL